MINREQQIIIYVAQINHVHVMAYRANGSGLAMVLAGPVFLKEIIFHFCKKQVTSKSASVILGLVRLFIFSYNR